MEVVAKTKLDLIPHVEQFEYQFAWKRKSGVNKNYWFTPTGKCKIWIGSLYTDRVGTIEKSEWDELVKQLKKNKCEAFTNQWRSVFYTTTGDNGISTLGNFGVTLGNARDEWEKRKYIEFWVEEGED